MTLYSFTITLIYALDLSGTAIRRFITLLYYMSYASDTDKGEPFSALYGHTGHRLDALDMVPGYTLHVIEYMRHLSLNILPEPY